MESTEMKYEILRPSMPSSVESQRFLNLPRGYQVICREIVCDKLDYFLVARIGYVKVRNEHANFFLCREDGKLTWWAQGLADKENISEKFAVFTSIKQITACIDSEGFEDGRSGHIYKLHHDSPGVLHLMFHSAWKKESGKAAFSKEYYFSTGDAEWIKLTEKNRKWLLPREAKR